MSVWFAIPSARPAAEADACLAEWRGRGYRVAAWRDDEARLTAANFVYRTNKGYPGYAQAVNKLAKDILLLDPSAEWIVTGGDDTMPDEKRMPDAVGAECTAHFGGTFGVMQPTGDRFAGGSIDRIAGSPWLGREWCERANGGAGPLWPEFTHMFVDECLQRTAQKLGVFWQRPDLVHFHRHFMRESDRLDARAVKADTPAHLERWNAPAHWNEMKAIFERLRAEDFAPCMPRPA